MARLHRDMEMAGYYNPDNMEDLSANLATVGLKRYSKWPGVYKGMVDGML